MWADLRAKQLYINESSHYTFLSGPVDTFLTEAYV
jgi:hypothetical protein